MFSTPDVDLFKTVQARLSRDETLDRAAAGSMKPIRESFQGLQE